MKISGRKQVSSTSSISPPVSQPAIDKAPAPSIEQATDVELSGSLKEVDQAKIKLNAMPDVRAEILQEIKPKIDDGSYKVQSGKIAKRIVNASLRESARNKNNNK